MASFNKITIVGYLGRDPELRHTPQGDAVCNFSVATTERRKNAAGDYDDHTTWFKVTVWQRKAEVANDYLRKGSQVYVEGRLRQTEYQDRESNTRTQLEVTASDIQFLGNKSDNHHASDNLNDNRELSRDEKKTAIQKALGVQAPLPGTGDGKRRIRIDDDDDSIPF